MEKGRRTPSKTPVHRVNATPSRLQSLAQFLGLSPKSPSMTETQRIRRSARLMDKSRLTDELEVAYEYRGDVNPGAEYPEFFGEYEIIEGAFLCLSD